MRHGHSCDQITLIPGMRQFKFCLITLGANPLVKASGRCPITTYSPTTSDGRTASDAVSPGEQVMADSNCEDSGERVQAELGGNGPADAQPISENLADSDVTEQ
jgi:hypothetical protein